MDDFGSSAPFEALLDYYGFTAEKLADQIRNLSK
jgi:transketolase